MSTTTREDLKIGPLEFVALRGELEPAVTPRVDLRIKGQYEGRDTVDPISMSTEQWEELKQVGDLLENVVNFVPITMLLTALLDRDLVSEKWLRLVADQIEPGTIHFRPSDPSTKRVAREIVGRLLRLED